MSGFQNDALAVAPVRGRDRIAILDILRGFAILGIFYINLPAMMGPLGASIGDMRSLGWSPADQTAWLILETTWEGTQRGILELLFGAGLMVTAAKAMEGSGPVAVADLYIRRNLWLLAFGLFDIFALLWFSDILHVYALCALALFPFRKLRVRWLLLIGLTFALLQAAGGTAAYFSRVSDQATYQVATQKQEKGIKLSKEEQDVVEDWRKHQDLIDGKDKDSQKLANDEAKARAGSMGDYAGFLIGTYLWSAGGGSLLADIIEAFSVMLIGIALWKIGLVQGKRTTREYFVALVVAYGFGLTARYFGGLERMEFYPGPKTIWMTEELARISVSLGHIAALNLLVRLAAGRSLLAPLKAAGQMAFTLYFMQQIIGIWIFYSPIGLDMPSAQGWAHATLLASGVVIFLLVFANIWMKYFVSGPFEWVWRSLSYVRKQPFLRRSG